VHKVWELIFNHFIGILNYMVTIFGQKLKTGEKLTAPKNEAVLSYLKAAKDGQGKAQKYIKTI
jgi:hypothetical protein